MLEDVSQRIDEAIRRRAPLLSAGELDACRLVNGAADGLPGVVVERFASVLVVQLHEGRRETDLESLRPVFEGVCDRLSLQAVYVKIFVRDRSRAGAGLDRMHRDPTPWIGLASAREVLIRESGLKFIIRPWDGFSVGLFLDQRDNRQLVRRHAAGRRVLNTFCYTCGFSVAAAVGGAAHVSSVDMSRRYLSWGRLNFEANDLELVAPRFFNSDVFDFYERAKRQGRRFDLVIIDPPTFSRSRRPARVFVLQDRMRDLFAGALEILDPGGLVLLSTNDRSLPCKAIEHEIERAAAGREHRILERPPLPVDFAGDPDYARSLLVQFR